MYRQSPLQDLLIDQEAWIRCRHVAQILPDAARSPLAEILPCRCCLRPPPRCQNLPSLLVRYLVHLRSG